MQKLQREANWRNWLRQHKHSPGELIIALRSEAKALERSSYRQWMTAIDHTVVEYLLSAAETFRIDHSTVRPVPPVMGWACVVNEADSQ